MRPHHFPDDQQIGLRIRFHCWTGERTLLTWNPFGARHKFRNTANPNIQSGRLTNSAKTWQNRLCGQEAVGPGRGNGPGIHKRGKNFFFGAWKCRKNKHAGAKLSHWPNSLLRRIFHTCRRELSSAITRKCICAFCSKNSAPRIDQQ
jgi:hypothetical protein